MKEIIINSFEDFVSKTFENSYDENIRRYRTSLVYRGLSSSKWNLQSSIQRHCGVLADNLEENLIRNFKKYASNEISRIQGQESEWKTLAIGQHHGLPTRLLDWTYSPLVALHFATEDMSKMSEDAVVYMLDLSITNEKLPNAIKPLIKNENSFVFTSDMLTSNFRTLKEFDKISKNDFLAFFEPPAIDSRIVNQFGLFSITNGARVNIEGLLEQNNAIKLIIPSEKKMQLRDYLDQMNINERILFPGLDGLSSWLQRHYKPYQIWEEENVLRKEKE